MVVVVRERRWTLGDALRSDQQTTSPHAPSQRRVLSTCPRRRVQIWMTRSRIGSSAVRTLPRTIRSSGKRPGGVEPVGSVGQSPDFGSFASLLLAPAPTAPPAKSDSSRNIIPASSYIRSRPYAAQTGYHEGLHTRVRCIRTCSSNCPENSRCPPEILPPPPMMHPVQLFASSPPSPLRSASFAHPSNPLQTRPFPLHSHLLLPTQPVPVRSAQASYHSRSPPTPPRHRLVSPSPSPRNAPTLGIPNQPPTVKSPPE